MDKTIVLILYGTGKAINDFSITLFDNDRNGFVNSTVKDYCANINDLELKDDNWIYATKIEENQKINFKKPGSCTDFDMLSILDDRSIQKVIREVDWNILAQALKSAEKKTFKAILRNMSKRAARMLIEEMEYMCVIRLEDVKKARMMIVSIMRHLEDIGEINIPRFSLDEKN